MSNFSNQANKKEDTRKVESGRREALGKYFYDLSKLTFAGWVLGMAVPLSQDIDNTNYRFLLGGGLLLTFLLASYANKLHKYKKL